MGPGRVSALLVDNSVACGEDFALLVFLLFGCVFGLGYDGGSIC